MSDAVMDMLSDGKYAVPAVRIGVIYSPLACLTM